MCACVCKLMVHICVICLNCLSCNFNSPSFHCWQWWGVPRGSGPRRFDHSIKLLAFRQFPEANCIILWHLSQTRSVTHVSSPSVAFCRTEIFQLSCRRRSTLVWVGRAWSWMMLGSEQDIQCQYRGWRKWTWVPIPNLSVEIVKFCIEQIVNRFQIICLHSVPNCTKL